MKHTINTAACLITIEATGKPDTERCKVTVKTPFLPAFDAHLTAEDASLLAQAFDLVAEEIGS